MRDAALVNARLPSVKVPNASRDLYILHRGQSMKALKLSISAHGNAAVF
jgi:hypothetical protein